MNGIQLDDLIAMMGELRVKNVKYQLPSLRAGDAGLLDVFKKDVPTVPATNLCTRLYGMEVQVDTSLPADVLVMESDHEVTAFNFSRNKAVKIEKDQFAFLGPAASAAARKAAVALACPDLSRNTTTEGGNDVG